MNPYLDPALHLQLMQEAGIRSTPGFGLPMGGVTALGQMSSMYAPPISGNPLPNTAPLSMLGLESYGLPGMLASLSGNFAVTAMLNNQGLTPMGSAGSYQQAQQALRFQEMQRAVSAAVANQDADSFYRSMRGAAALTGNPFDQSQRLAARRLANSIAAAGPFLGINAPQFLDAMAGDTGSVQAMTAQMMETNRYRIDPRTGNIGFTQASNVDFINEIYDNLFKRDNLAQMHGIRAGEAGQLYRELSANGMLSNRGSLRARTIDAIQAARTNKTLGPLLTAENLQGLSQLDQDILAGGDNLHGLSTEALTRFRQLDPIKTQFTTREATDVSGRLKEYAGAISAIKDVFGENGNPNAPMPMLFNALKALTSGNMQRFDAGQLNAIVRDMQSMSQLSGKSIDQLTFMMQSANQSNTAVLGNLGGVFNPLTVNAAVAAGMQHAAGGGMVGFGALNREQTEQAAMSLMSRSLGSTMMNSLGAVIRLEQAGGFSNNAAGQRLSAIMQAIRGGRETYSFDGQEYDIPRQEAEFRNLIAQGAVANVDMSSFGMMLQDNVANQRALFETPAAQQAAYIASRKETMNNIALAAAGRISAFEDIKSLNAEDRKGVSLALGRAATEALNGMTDVTDTEARTATMADAIKQAAAQLNVNISDNAARQMAVNMYGAADNAARARGLDSYEGLHQFIGKQNLDGMLLNQNTIAAQAGINQAMSNLGPRGGMLQRFFSALQNQGNRGTEADLNTLVADIFSGDSRLKAGALVKPMQEISLLKTEIDTLVGKLSSASPEERASIMAEIQTKTKNLEGLVNTAQQLVLDNNLDTGTIGGISALELDKRRAALRERSIQVNGLVDQGGITEAEIAAHNSSIVGKSDIISLARAERNRLLAEADNLAAGDLSGLSKADSSFYTDAVARFGEPEARAKLRSRLRSRVNSAENIANNKEFVDQYSGMGFSKLNAADRMAVALGRRQNLDFRPNEKQVTERQQALLVKMGFSKTKTEDELKKMTPEEREAYEQEQRTAILTAERQLMAESQLKAMGLLGKDENIMDSAEAIGKTLGLELTSLNMEQRVGAVESALDKRILSQLTDKEGVDQTKLKGLLDATAKVQGLKIGTDSSTNLEKLDLLLDAYSDTATSEDRDKLATKYGLSRTDLDKIVADTEFTKLSEDKEGVTVRDMLDRLQDVTTEETEQEKQMSITGVLEIVGDVVGKGTIANATGVW